MNKKAYEKLPPDMKKVIDDHSGRNIAQWAGQNWVDIEGPGRKIVASKKKNKFHVIPAAEVDKMRNASKPVFERWLKEMKGLGIDGEALLTDARAMIDKHAK